MTINKLIAELNYLKELINYRKSNQDNKKGIDSNTFAFYVNEFLQNVADEFGKILTDILSDHDLKVDVEKRVSNGYNLYFHINGNKDEYFQLHKGKIYRVGETYSIPIFDKGDMNVASTFLEEELTNSKKEELLKVSEAYTNFCVNVLKGVRIIHLTKNLSLNYTFKNGVHFYIYDEKRGYKNSYRVLEKNSFLLHLDAHDENDPKINDVILINKLPSIGVIDEEYVQEFNEIEKSTEEIIIKLREDLGMQAPGQSEGNEEVKELKKN